MEINYLAVLVSAVLSMVIGGIWYGPLFGKLWFKVVGADASDLEARKEMQKKAGPLYLIQFVLSLFQVFVLAVIINVFTNMSALETALWMYAGFIVPMVAAGAMWNNDSKEVSWTRFWIQAGYQLILFIMFGLILGFWK